jgi:hypothetical protein
MPEKKKSGKPAPKKSNKPQAKNKPKAQSKAQAKPDIFLPKLNTKVSPEQWARLFDLAAKYQELKPWEWLYDTDFFAIKTPNHAELCYGSVMGKAGKLFGLTCYIGQVGLLAFLDTADGYIHELDFRYAQKCMMCTYDPKNELTDIDLELLQHARVKPKGKLLPVYRSYEPGLLEWYLAEPWQADLLADILEAVLYIAPIAKAEPARMLPEDENLVLLLTSKDTPDGRVWTESFFTPDVPEMDVCAPLPVDELRVRRIKAATENSEDTWEADLFYAPSPVAENEEQRPYFPRMSMIIDIENGMPLHFSMDEQATGPSYFQEAFLQTLEKTKIRPKTLYICRAETESAVKLAADSLGIAVELVEELPIITHLREELEESVLDMDTDALDELDIPELPGAKG